MTELWSDTRVAVRGLPEDQAEKLFAKLGALLKIWEKWSVFSPPFFKGIQASLRHVRASVLVSCWCLIVYCQGVFAEWLLLVGVCVL